MDRYTERLPQILSRARALKTSFRVACIIATEGDGWYEGHNAEDEHQIVYHAEEDALRAMKNAADESGIVHVALATDQKGQQNLKKRRVLSNPFSDNIPLVDHLWIFFCASM